VARQGTLDDAEIASIQRELDSAALDSASLFMPGNSITSALANEFAEAESGLHVAALMELGLILFVITFIVLAISKLMIMRLAKNEGAR
jgi:phosphate transport system permease protein